MTQIEFSILRFFHSLTGWAPLDNLVVSFTKLGDAGAIFVITTVVLLCFQKTRRFGLYAAVALVCELLIVNVTLKPLINRPRPFTYLQQFGNLIAAPRDSSFPSGHTAAAFAFAFALRPAGKKWFVLLLVFAIAMGLSRLYLTVHYLSDVIVGAVIGALCGLFAISTVRKALAYTNRLGGK